MRRFEVCADPLACAFPDCDCPRAPQTDIPDDLKADADLPLDVIAAMASLRFQLILAVNTLDRLVEAVERR